MKRLITICIAVTAIALIAAPAFAEVQNVKVSGDVDSKGVFRENFTLLSENQLTSSDTNTDNSTTRNGIITSARVRIDADLTDNVSATVRYLTEYYWDTVDNTSGTGDDVDLDLANVTLKEAFYGPLTLIIGRQPLRFGNAFVLGDPDTNTASVKQQDDGTLAYGDLSLRKSFDAVRAILDYNPLTVDLIYSKIDETAAPGVNTENRDIDLYGANAAYDFTNYDAEVELYYLFLRDDTNTGPDPDNSAKTIRNSFRPGNQIHTFGARGSIAPVDRLNLMGEFGVQRGDYDDVSATKRDQSAYAFQVAGDYSLDLGWAPVVRAGWTHYEGEERGNSGDHDGWLPLFEDQSHGVVANWVLGGVNGGQNSNADILNIGATVEPLEDLTLSLDFYNFWLDENLVSVDNSDSNGANGNTGLGWYNLDHADVVYYLNSDDELGYEIDLALNYDYTEDVNMGLSAGWFVPGNAFEGASGASENDEIAIQVLATLDVTF